MTGFLSMKQLRTFGRTEKNHHNKTTTQDSLEVCTCIVEFFFFDFIFTSRKRAHGTGSVTVMHIFRLPEVETYYVLKQDG